MSAIIGLVAWVAGAILLAGLAFGAGYIAAVAFRAVGRHK